MKNMLQLAHVMLGKKKDVTTDPSHMYYKIY